MNKISKITLGLVLTLVLAVQTQAFAAEKPVTINPSIKTANSGIGYIDMNRIQAESPYVQNIVKQISQKELELQEYLLKKEKESKNLSTPVQKATFEKQVKKEFDAKRDAYVKFKETKEIEVYNKIKDITRNVLVEQKLDAVVDVRLVFVGGVDITDLVLSKLKFAK